MSTRTSLKRKNSPYLWTFFTFNILMFIGLFFVAHFETILNDFKTMFTLRSSGILLAPIILFVVNGLLSAKQKAVIVFWKFKNPLPGSRAFTVHAPADMRVNLDRLESLHGTLPIYHKDQNKLWYKIYRKHISDIVIQKSHKDFLLGRDLACMAFLFILFLGIPMLFFSKEPLTLLYISFLLLEYFFLVRVAQNYGKRFVCNVLAIEGSN